MRTKTALISVGIVAFVVGLVLQSSPVAPLGSVTVGNEYFATTTSTISGHSVIWSITQNTSAKTGTLGSVVQTAAGSAGGNINIYDATTTNVLARTGQKATSSILLASIPTAATVGTYQFDAVFNHGLVVVADGTIGTTTITWR